MQCVSVDDDRVEAVKPLRLSGPKLSPEDVRIVRFTPAVISVLDDIKGLLHTDVVTR